MLALVAAGLLVASCTTGDSQATTAATPAPSEDLAVTVASFDLSVGDTGTSGPAGSPTNRVARPRQSVLLPRPPAQ